MFNWATRLLTFIGLRRFEAAETDRLNVAHWSNTGGDQNINAALDVDLPTLRDRTIYEAENNPYLAGVIRTHKGDVVGAHGPSLQIQSDSSDYNDALEEMWSQWSESPAITGDVSLVELLQQDIGMLWMCGEFLDQLVSEPGDGNGVNLRINPIHPRRLGNPATSSSNPLLQMGVERLPNGKVTRYWIEDFLSDQGQSVSYGHKPYDAKEIIHGFERFEPGQVRGIPLAAPALPAIAEIRDYDTAVRRAVRVAAEFGVLLHSNHPDIQPIVVNETVKMEGGVIRTCPPGWMPTQIKPEHPQQNYREFHNEQLRSIGRAVNMPLMMVMLDSGDANYSAARFNAQLYNRGTQSLQAWLTRIKLRRVFAEFQSEASLLAKIAKPKQVSLQWTWPVAPHVDPEKEAAAIQLLMEMKLLSEFEAAAMLGRDYEATLKLMKRAAELRESLGVDGNQPAEQKADEIAKAQRAVADIMARSVSENIFTVTL